MADIISNFNWTYVYQRVLSLIAALLCISFHEVSHGFVAYKLGDNTARSMGRLSLNPIRHIDIVGLLAFVFVGFGWAKPVQIDPRNFKNPKAGMAISALAGPVSNFIMAVVFLFLLGFLYPFLKTGEVGTFFLNLIYLTATFSVTLGVFNLVPVPPLDGSKLLFAVASDQLYYKLMKYERYGYIFLLGVIYLNYQTGFLSIATETIMNVLSGITQAAFNLSSLLAGS